MDKKIRENERILYQFSKFVINSGNNAFMLIFHWIHERTYNIINIKSNLIEVILSNVKNNLIEIDFSRLTFNSMIIESD